MIDWTANAKLRQTAAVAQCGGVIAYPTEAVWGLGCDPWNERAFQSLLALKRRPLHKGVILIADSVDKFCPFLTGIDARHRALIAGPAANPTTWLVPDNGVVPRWVIGEHSTLALRVTTHPVAAALCKLFNGPLVSTSANPASLPPARSALKVRCYFANALDAIAPGQVGAHPRPSQIRDLYSGEVLRNS